MNAQSERHNLVDPVVVTESPAELSNTLRAGFGNPTLSRNFGNFHQFQLSPHSIRGSYAVNDLNDLINLESLDSYLNFKGAFENE